MILKNNLWRIRFKIKDKIKVTLNFKVLNKIKRLYLISLRCKNKIINKILII